MPEARWTCEAWVDLDVPVEEAWEALMDFERYPQWNPFVWRIRAPDGAHIGARLKLDVTFDDGRKARASERITELSPPRDGRARLTYRYDSALAHLRLLRSDRSHDLEARGASGCRYHTREQFRGPFRRLIPLAAIQRGFDAQVSAMKAFVEREHEHH